MKPERIKLMTPIASIFAILVLESIALLKGIDGAALSTTFAVIGGLGGYGVKTYKERSR